MQKHLELSDLEFERAFSNCTIDPGIFSHEAHLRLAWIHINKYGVESAVENIRQQLQKFVKSVDAENKYHETVTVASIRAVNHFFQKSKTESFSDFISENKQLLDNFKNLLLTHYKTDIFKSLVAKETYLEPEKIPFD